MTFSAHLPMNLAISGLSSAQPCRKETKQLATKTWWYIRLSQSVFDILTMNLKKKKTEEI